MMLIFVELLNTKTSVSHTQIINYLTEKIFNCIIDKFNKRLRFIVEGYDSFTLGEKNAIKKYMNNFIFKNKNKFMTICLLKLSFILKAFLVDSKLIFVSKLNKQNFGYSSDTFFLHVLYDVLDSSRFPQLVPPNKMGPEKYRLNVFGQIEGLIRCKSNLKLDVKLSKNFLVVFNQMEGMKFKINIKFYLLLKKLDKMPLAQTRGMDLEFPTIAQVIEAESQANLTKKNMLSKKDQTKAKEIRNKTNFTDYDIVLSLVLDGLKISLRAYNLHREACKY